MAKAQRAKYTSKGQRRNSKLHKPAPKLMGGNMNNAMREAFMNAEMTETVRFSRLGAIIIRQGSKPAKLTAEQEKGWSAKLSYRTYTSLKDQGYPV